MIFARGLLYIKYNLIKTWEFLDLVMLKMNNFFKKINKYNFLVLFL